MASAELDEALPHLRIKLKCFAAYPSKTARRLSIPRVSCPTKRLSTPYALDRLMCSTFKPPSSRQSSSPDVECRLLPCPLVETVLYWARDVSLCKVCRNDLDWAGCGTWPHPLRTWTFSLDAGWPQQQLDHRHHNTCQCASLVHVLPL